VRRPIRAILFDKDGTLVDFQRTWGPATEVVLRRLAEGDAAAYRRLVRASLFLPDQQRFLPDSPIVIEKTEDYGPLWAEALGRPATPDFIAEIDRLFFDATLDSLAPVSDPRAILGRLAARGYALGVMTNDADINTRAQLARLGLDSLIKFLAAYDSGFGAKPEAAPVLAFAAAADVAPAEIAVVGDTLHDLHAARAAGAVGVAVLTGPVAREKLEPQADAVLDSIAELEGWLEGA
jgi:phosphoglycolate phosphatase